MKSSTLLQRPFSRGAGLNYNVQDAIAKIIPFRKSVAIGVVIYPDRIRMIKTTGASSITPILLDYKCVSIPPQIREQASGFKKFLKSELNQFYPSRKKPDIWTMVPSDHVDIIHIRIPKTQKMAIEKTVHWTIRKEKSFDEEESIIDFRVQGEVVENGSTKLSVMVYIARKDEIEKKKKLFSSIGIPLAGITIMPFAFENILRAGWVPNPGRTNAVLFIGNDFSRIDIYFQGKLAMSRDIRAGTKSKIDSLIEAFKHKTHPSSSEAEGEDIQIDDEQARKVLFSFSQDTPPLAEGDVGFGLKEEELLEMILPALNRLARQVKLTIDYYESNPGTEKVDKLYISGVMDIYRPILEHLGSQLGIKGSVLDPLNSQIICKDLKCITERIAFVPALGIALSNSIRTPNLLYTQKDRKKEAKINRINVGIFAVFMIVVSICSIMFVYQRHDKIKKKAVLANIEEQLSEYKPRLDKNVILKMVADVTQQQETFRMYGKKYLGLAVINELSIMTPTNIRITNLKAYLGDVSTAGKSKVKGESLVIEGIVHGEHHTLEAALLDYVLKLQTSPIFSNVNLQKKDFASSNIGLVLDFSINIKIEV